LGSLDEGPTEIPVPPVVAEDGPLGVMEDMDVGSMEAMLGVGVDMACDGEEVSVDDKTSKGCTGDEHAGLEGVPREVLYSNKTSVVCSCSHYMLSPSLWKS
jgi:hypothetical protein